MTDELEGRTALVTGASAGLGVDFARELAERGADVILVARREERLREVADDLEGGYGVRADTISMDLARDEAAEELYEEVRGRGHEVDILVNNAGFGIWGDFLEADREQLDDMMKLDIMTPVHLTRLFGEQMAERGWGRILQVASIGAYQPSPKYASYSAAKSFVRSWGEAIDFEMREHGVSCTVVSPGATATEFFDAAGQDARTWYQKIFMMESSTVADIGIRAMLNQRMSIVVGFTNAFNAWLTRFLPRRLVRWIAYLTMKDGQKG